MAGYDLDITVKPEYHESAKKFFEFLKNVGKKYPVVIKYKTISEGSFYVTVDGSPGAKIDALFQELILNKALYYYTCSLLGSIRGKIIRNVIYPIYRALVESRFANPHSKFILSHIKGKIPSYQHVPGEFFDTFSNEYEVIFRKWDIGLLSDWEFIVDVDTFLNRFLLISIGHKEGDKSKKFDALCIEASKTGIVLSPKAIHLFSTVHKARTLGLHRLKELLKKDEIVEIAMGVYWYFELYDEFRESQNEKTEIFNDKRYKRIRYGYEKFVDEDGNLYKNENGYYIDWKKIAVQKPCHDCDVIFGQFHLHGCDVEQCACCGGQRLGCECARDEID